MNSSEKYVWNLSTEVYWFGLTDETRNIIKWMDTLEPFYILLVVFAGLVSNITNLVLIALKKNNRRANSILISLSTSDMGFLLTLVVVTFRHLSMNIFDKSDVVCKGVVYSTFVFSFSSNWLVAIFSVERFIVVYFPFVGMKRIRNPKRSRLVAVAPFFLAALIYAHTLFASSVELVHNLSTCAPKQAWFDVIRITVVADSIVAIVAPFVIILFINMSLVIFMMRHRHLTNSCTGKCSVVIVSSKYKSAVGAKRLSPKRRLSLDSTRRFDKRRHAEAELNVLPNHVVYRRRLSAPANGQFATSGMLKRAGSYSRSTCVLLVVSGIFLVVQAPLVFCKIRYGFIALTKYNLGVEISPHEEIIERITCYIYYFQFAFNCLLHSNMKRSLRKLKR